MLAIEKSPEFKYHYMTYREVLETTLFLAKGLEEDKLFSEASHNGRKLKIIGGDQEEAPMEEMILIMALWHIGGTYAAGIESYEFWEDITILATTAEYLNTIISGDSSYKHIKKIIVYDEPKKELKDLCISKGILLKTMSEIIEKGKTSTIALKECESQDACFLSDTSGTTGAEKLVVLSHELGVFLSIYSSSRYFKDTLNTVQQYEQYISLITLSIFAACWEFGGKMSWRSYTESIFDDMLLSQPSLIIIFPNVIMNLYEIYKKKISENPHFSASRMFGDQIKAILCTGAPLSSEIAEFAMKNFKSVFINCYGNSEIGGIAASMIGGPLNKVKLLYGRKAKIVENKKCENFAKAKMPFPFGELYIAPPVFAGYFRHPELNADSFDADGWLKTSTSFSSSIQFILDDVAMALPDGSFTILARMGAVIKNASVK